MIEKDEVEKLAILARIKMDKDEAEGFTNDFENILSYVSNLKELDTDNISEEIDNIYPKNVLREDINPHDGGLYTEQILKEAPNKEGTYIHVDKILNQE